jgi:uncharacterized protein (TIGR02246 family)
MDSTSDKSSGPCPDSRSGATAIEPISTNDLSSKCGRRTIVQITRDSRRAHLEGVYRVTQLTAADAIRQLHADYTDAVWRKDLTAFGECFTEDAEWRIAGRVVRGRGAIVQFMGAAFPKYRWIMLNFRSPSLKIEGSKGSGRVYVSEQSVLADGRPYSPIGVYYERFLEQKDRWRFAWRLFHTCYLGPPDLSGSFFENPDFGPPPAMPPMDAASYDRSGILTGKANPTGD